MSEPARPRATGGAVVGLLLAAAGVAWLLGTTGAVDWSAETWIGALLVAVGAALVAFPSTAGRGLLVALGIVLALAGSAAATIDVRLEGGVGEELVTPESAAALEDEYDLAAGSLKLDLGGLEPASDVVVAASVGVGELVVAVPDGAAVALDASAGIGDVQALGAQDSGFGAGLERRFGGGEGPLYRLDLSVGIGSIRVVDDGSL